MTRLASGVETRIERFRARDVTEPMPALASFGAALYDAVFPLAEFDGQTGWHLAHFAGAIGAMFQPVADVARDTPEGPGWSAVVDLGRCPDAWLPWLAQFAGVSIPVGTPADAARARIAGVDGFKRGTPASIRAAIQATLTGSKTVVLQERLGGNAYVLGVYTLTPETPDAAKTRAAILTQKPGGIRLDYTVGAANTYQAANVGYASYNALKTAFSNYNHLAAGLPG